MAEEQDYFESEEFRETLSKYEASVAAGQTIYMDADDLADIADYYQGEGRPEDAKAAIELALQFNPDAVGPTLYMAREALWRQDYDQAREYADRLRLSDPTEHLYMQAEILIAEGRTKEADRLLRDHLAEVPPDEHEDYVYDVANLYSEYELHDRAMQWMARSRGDDSDDFKELMARTLFGLGKYEDSGRIFNELIDHNPFSKHYWNALASTQFMCEDYGAAVTSSEYAIAIDPDDAESLLSKANGLHRLENYEEALNYFERYSEKVPDDEYGLLHQATCLINLGRHKEAIEKLQQAVDTAPDDSPYLCDIYQELAFAYSEQRQPDNALYYLDQTLRLDCDHTEMEVVRGHILMANGRLQEAEQVFKQAVLNSDDTPKTIIRIIVSLYDNRFVTAAYTMFKQFFKYTGKDWRDGFAYMALCCWDLHRDEEFMHYMRLAVERNPREARSVLGHLFPQDIQPKDYEKYITEQYNEA